MPDAPKQPTVKDVYHDSALISWEPPADGGKPITGYIVERKETMANRSTHTSVNYVSLCLSYNKNKLKTSRTRLKHQLLFIVMSCPHDQFTQKDGEEEITGHIPENTELRGHYMTENPSGPERQMMNE